MFYIYTARENVHKDKFMFERIASAMRSRRVFLIVPEQSTLRAEADAFEYMDAPGFIDFDVLSMTSLGRRVLEDTGYGATSGGEERLSFISKYGKFMLLSRLLYRRADEMGVFKRLEASPDFIEKLNNMLAELKNHNVTATDLKEIASEMKTDTILKRKIEDAALVYEGYEEAIGGRYMDQTDHLKLYTSKIGRASFIPDAEFWFSGFDYLSPAVIDAVVEIARHSAAANIVLTSDAGTGRTDPLFALTNGLAAELARRAAETGVESRVEPIPSGEGSNYLRGIPPEIAHIERALFTRPHTPFPNNDIGKAFDNGGGGASDTRCDDPGGAIAGASSDVIDDALKTRPPALRLIAAANYYAEAETAAADICGLIRDGLPAPSGGRDEIRYRDILVLCNDMAERGPIIRRVFHRYGLPVFMDRRRSVEHNPVIEFLLALPRIAASGRRYEDVFTLLKTGLTDIGTDEIEEIENYAVKYNIKGSMWNRDFTFGLKREDAHGYVKGEYDQEELDALNVTRRGIASLINEFETGFKSGRSAKVRTDALLTFLVGRARLPEMIERYVADLEGAGMLEYAAEMSGMWDVAEEILGQMSTVLGDLTMSMEEYATVLRVGLDSVRVGVLPTVIDQIVLGTMQRTRSGNAKVVFVLGANDGVLPASVSDGAVFSEDEVYRLADAGCAVARTEETMHREEELAIYRNFSKPSALLRVSYAASDSTGRSISPSPVFERLRRLFPDTPIERDIENVSAGGQKDPIDTLANIQHPDRALDSLSANLRAYVNGDPLPEAWKNVAAWYRANRPGDIERVIAGLTFRGRHERVGAKFVDGLYRRVTSPSALERYSRCPFSWFMSYGLGLKENRAARTDARDIGEVYHNVLMRFGRELSSDGLPPSDEDSRWRTVKDEEILDTIERLVSEEYPARSESGGGTETNAADAGLDTYRMRRIGLTATFAARALTYQIRESRACDIYFETAFGEKSDFPPITTASGETRVEGRIDRVDILDGGYARIVDYKSGAQEFSSPDAASGYQLQLMLYLKAVSERYKPAGVFYFRIKEPRVEDYGGDDSAVDILKKVKPDGVAVNDARSLTAMGIDPGGKAKKGIMEAGEFNELRDAVGALVDDLIKSMSHGRVDAEPKTAIKLKTSDNRNMKACDYCQYKGICNYDSANT